MRSDYRRPAQPTIKSSFANTLEKGAAYYFSSYAFMTKLSVFIVVGVLSAIPTIEFMSWRKALRAGQAPAPSERKSQ